MEPVLAGVVSAFLKEAIKPISDGVRALGKEALIKGQVIFESCFSKYVERSYQRYSKTKTLLYRERPVSLKDFYVRTDLYHRNGLVRESEFIGELKNSRRVVVSGTAGSGKSTFCKSIFVELVERPEGIIPIFIELRHLNSSGRKSLYEFVTESLSSVEPDFSNVHLEYALQQGKLLLIFDGFDEIDGDVRDIYERELIELSNKYHRVMVLVSSRPDSRFNSWEEFYKYDVCPLSKEKATRLIGKLEYDSQVKSKFLKALDDSLYEKHVSFASTPLLLTMMLLTYEQIAEIPNKIHLFYEQAFLTLFNKHDSLKSLYKRKSFSELPLDDFKRVFSAFSILSYIERKYYFSESEVIGILNKAVKISGVGCDAALFLKDLLDSVCMMQRDGLGYTFTHRSFQEYFTALFVINLSSENKFQIIDRVAFVNDRDIVIPIVYDMSPELLEREWIIPRLKEYIDEMESVLGRPDEEILLLAKHYRALVSHRDGVAYTHQNEGGGHVSFIHLLSRVYSHEVAKYFRMKKNKLTLAQKAVEEDLIRIDLKHPEGVRLDNFEGLSKATKQRIVKSGSARLGAIFLEYAKEKLRKLERKHSRKQQSLESLLLG